MKQNKLAAKIFWLAWTTHPSVFWLELKLPNLQLARVHWLSIAIVITSDACYYFVGRLILCCQMSRTFKGSAHVTTAAPVVSLCVQPDMREVQRLWHVYHFRLIAKVPDNLEGHCWHGVTVGALDSLDHTPVDLDIKDRTVVQSSQSQTILQLLACSWQQGNVTRLMTGW